MGKIAAVISGGINERPRAICNDEETPVVRTSVGNTSLKRAPKTVAPFEPKYSRKKGTRIHGLLSRDFQTAKRISPPTAAVPARYERVTRRPQRSLVYAPTTQPTSPAKAVKKSHHAALPSAKCWYFTR